MTSGESERMFAGTPRPGPPEAFPRSVWVLIVALLTIAGFLSFGPFWSGPCVTLGFVLGLYSFRG